MNKRIGHTILAVFVALSVAIVPATAGFATTAKAVATSNAIVDSPAAETVPDCDHHHAQPSDTKQKSADGCDSMAGCALKCFNLTTTSFFSLSYSSSPIAMLEPIRRESKVTSQIGSPPFRPPRS